jgi:hypothetical protein
LTVERSSIMEDEMGQHISAKQLAQWRFLVLTTVLLGCVHQTREAQHSAHADPKEIDAALPSAASTAAPRVAYAASVLLTATPSGWGADGRFVGMKRYTAAELARIGQGAAFGKTTFIPGNVPSTDPETVSANPIDEYTWGGAAYSTRAGRCYVIVVAVDRQNPKYGSMFYGILAPGEPCVGNAATLQTATSKDQLPE